MTTTVRVSARLVPWDDPEFVRAFEEAQADTERSGCCPDVPESAERVQHLLREAGYPHAVVDVVRTVEEALHHVSHWTVRRDG